MASSVSGTISLLNLVNLDSFFLNLLLFLLIDVFEEKIVGLVVELRYKQVVLGVFVAVEDKRVVIFEGLVAKFTEDLIIEEIS
jgi:hypothetical protein